MLMHAFMRIYGGKSCLLFYDQHLSKTDNFMQN